MAKYLSGRVQRTPQSGLTSDRYSYLSLDQAEPNLGDPAVPGVILPSGVQYQLISVLNHPGERYWIPVGGGLIPGSISVYDEGLLVPPGGVSSITQLNFVGAAISASGYLDSYGNPGTISTITVFAPGNNKELIFNSNNEFSSSVDLTYDTNTGILTAARILNVGTGGTVFSTTGIGSVGIGTTNPTTKLHIVGDLRLTGTIYDYANNPGISQQILVKNNLGSLVWTSQGSIKAGAGGTFNQVQYHNSAGLVDGAANFVYDPITGNVGIGSTLPTYLLDVAGNTRITGITTLNKLYVTGISTFSSSADSTNTTSGALIISGGVGIAKNLNVGAVISTQSLNVTGQTTTQNLNVVGVSTLFDITGTSANFTGIVTASTFKGQISSGVGTITTFNSTTGIITALTGTAVTYTTGNITTLNGSNLYYNTGIITSLTSTNSSLANIISSGISTLGITTTTQLTARNLNVSGITTTQTLNVSGTSTFGGSIIPSATTTYNIGNINYKWNSLYVSTIVADQITGNTTTATSVIGGYADITSSNVSGISTTQYLVVLGNSSLGIATATSVTANTFTGSLNGNANTATKLATGRTIAITGDLAYTSPSFDGTVNVTGIGTLSNTGVTSATYGSSTTVPQIAIDAKGRITSASNVGVNFSAATVASADKLTTARTIAITGDLAYTSPPFDGTANVTGISTLANTGVVAATYGSSTTVPQIAIDAKGRITSASNVGVNFSAATVASADKLTTGRTISITGDLAYTSPSFDGTVNVTATGTLANTGVVAATYGSSTTVPQIIVDSKGRITSASNVGVNFSAATVASADKLTNGRTISITGDLTYTSPSFDGTVNVTATGTLASTGVVANTYGSGSQVPVFTVDSKGRITSVTNTSITGINASSVAAAGSNTQIQFNDSGVFAGNANLTFNKSTNTFATSIISASNSITAGTNTRYQIGNAYLSSGGDYAHLATHEWYNGSSWQTDSTPGGLFQITGQSFNWYKHNGTATHTLSLNLDSSGNLAATGTVTGTQLISTVATGISPFSINSTTQVSNLNSSYLQGYQVSSSATPSTIVLRDGNGDDYRRYGFGNYFNSTDDVSTGTLTYLIGKFGDNYYRSATAAKVASFISGQTMNINGSSTSCTGNAATSSNTSSISNAVGSSYTWDGVQYFRSNKGATSTLGANNTYGLEAYSSDGGAAAMSFHRGGYYAVNIGLDPDNVFRIGGWSASSNRLQMDMSGNLTMAGTVAGTNITSAGNVTGNASTATNLSTIRTNWSTNGTITAVVGQLSWKNYGNNHTIFDASASTSPDGGAINNTNSQVAWTSTYPTLMGWNGANTYGVRVDSARIADTTTSLASLTVNQTSYSCTNPITTATGNTINIASSSNAYGTKYVQSTAPTSPCDGDVWYDTSGTVATGGEFPSGTVLLFYQTSAPTGWSQVMTHNNKALRVVTGTGGGSGGSTAFTSVFASRTVPLVDHNHGVTDPTHYHIFPGDDMLYQANGYAGWTNRSAGGFPYDAVSTSSGGAQMWYTTNASTGITIKNASVTQTTGNTMDFAVQYIDIILCSKN